MLYKGLAERVQAIRVFGGEERDQRNLGNRNGLGPPLRCEPNPSRAF
jgi:hypothetical protein